MHQKVAGSVPSQGMYLGCGFDPWSGCVREATSRCFSHIIVFLFFSLLLPFSLESIIIITIIIIIKGIYSGEDLKRKD